MVAILSVCRRTGNNHLIGSPVAPGLDSVANEAILLLGQGDGDRHTPKLPPPHPAGNRSHRTKIAVGSRRPRASSRIVISPAVIVAAEPRERLARQFGDGDRRHADRVDRENEERRAVVEQRTGEASAIRAGRGTIPTPRPRGRARISAGRGQCRRSAARGATLAAHEFERVVDDPADRAHRRGRSAAGSRLPPTPPSSTRRGGSPPPPPPPRRQRADPGIAEDVEHLAAPPPPARPSSPSGTAMSGKKPRWRNGVLVARKLDRSARQRPRRSGTARVERFQRPPPSSSDPPRNSPFAVPVGLTRATTTPGVRGG